MNSSRNNDAHERARKLIALAGPEALSAADQLSLPAQSSNAWLAAHLETCASCRAFAENAAEMIRGCAQSQSQPNAAWSRPRS